MKKFIAVALATIATLYACSPKMTGETSRNTNQDQVDNSGKPMLLGIQSPAALNKSPFNEWYTKNYTGYKVNDTITDKIKPILKNTNFLIFMGTWCGDSKREVPRMFKILEACAVKKSQVKLVMLNDHDSFYKQSPGHEEAGLNIHRVPTFIVYKDQQELGRIVESPVVSLEEDLLSILTSQQYKSNYQAVLFMDSIFNHQSIADLESNLGTTVEMIRPLVKKASELNTYGYVLMAAKKMDKAGTVFRMNLLLYPKNANIYDSMGEYYFKTGNMNAAKENYSKVLELDPKNENAKKMLEKIGG